MPEPTEDGRPTRDGSAEAADTGYSEWISEVRRLYVEPKGAAETHVVEGDAAVPGQPTRGRGRIRGRGRRPQHAAGSAAPTEPAAVPTAPARPRLAELMTGETSPADADERPARAPVVAESAVPEGDAARSTVEPWAVVGRREPTSVVGGPVPVPGANVDGTALTGAGDGDASAVDAPLPAHSWWAEGALDVPSSDGAADETPERPSSPSTPAPEVTAGDDAPRSAWFDETPGAEIDDDAAPAPTAPDTRDASTTASDDQPSWPTPASGDPSSRREDTTEVPATRSQTRAATRLAARQRAARRRRALVAAVVLLVVVAAGWWVLRPHGAAAAGASARPGTGAVAVADPHTGPLRS